MDEGTANMLKIFQKMCPDKNPADGFQVQVCKPLIYKQEVDLLELFICRHVQENKFTDSYTQWKNLQENLLVRIWGIQTNVGVGSGLLPVQPLALWITNECPALLRVTL